MKRLSKSLLLLAFFIVLSAYCSSHLLKLHKYSQAQTISQLVYLPVQVTKILSLEFDGSIADYLMLKTMIFFGEKLERKEKPNTSQWEASFRALEVITSLDPRFWDPYILAITTYPWDAGMTKETITLLKKAAEARPEDHRPFFYIWFLYYQFEQNLDAATKYIKLASVKQNAPSYYSTLAARMDLYSGHTLRGALFLEDIYNQTSSQSQRKRLKKRIEALKRIAFLEEKTKDYVEKFKIKPKELQDLVRGGIIKAIPVDPYGGTFYINKEGRIYTTSKLAVLQKTKDQK